MTKQIVKTGKVVFINVEILDKKCFPVISNPSLP